MQMVLQTWYLEIHAVWKLSTFWLTYTSRLTRIEIIFDIALSGKTEMSLRLNVEMYIESTFSI